MTINLAIPVALAYYVAGVLFLRREWFPRNSRGGRAMDSFDGGVVLACAPLWPLWALGKLIAR